MALGCLAALLLMQCPCMSPTPSDWPTDVGLENGNLYLLKGGYTIEIELELFYEGNPHPVDGLNVIFYVNDTSIASFPGGSSTIEVKTVGGKANATIVSADRSGAANLLVFCCDRQACAVVNVLDYGSISGFVTDTHQQALPGALVTLWPNAFHNATTGQWEHDPTTAVIDPFVSENPQPAGNGSLAPAGTYTFSSVPLGTHIVEADASAISGNSSHRYFAVVDLVVEGAATANVVIPGRVITPAATTSPAPTTTGATQNTTMPTTTAGATSTTTSGGSGMAPLITLFSLIIVAAAFRKFAKRGSS